MAKVIMYVSGFCPYCTMAEKLLRSRGVEEIDKIRVDLHPNQRTEMIKKKLGGVPYLKSILERPI